MLGGSWGQEKSLGLEGRIHGPMHPQ
jgi:hypothetical protein